MQKNIKNKTEKEYLLIHHHRHYYPTTQARTVSRHTRQKNSSYLTLYNIQALDIIMQQYYRCYIINTIRILCTYS